MLECLRRDRERLLIALVATFGLLAFRSALGRSDLVHMMATLPVAAVLLVVAGDRLLDRWRLPSSRSALLGVRTFGLVALLLLAGLIHVPKPLANLQQFGSNVATLARQGHHPRGDRNVIRVVRWIQIHTEVDEPVLFLPNNGAYYFLTDRPNPIRFVMGHQIVTHAHRQEVLEDLRETRPRYVVWDHGAIRVDGIEDELVFGQALMEWIDVNYETAVRFDDVEILEAKASTSL
jgi:hypothetical protein